jgi:hypothetical protein
MKNKLSYSFKSTSLLLPFGIIIFFNPIDCNSFTRAKILLTGLTSPDNPTSPQTAVEEGTFTSL